MPTLTPESIAKLEAEFRAKLIAAVDSESEQLKAKADARLQASRKTGRLLGSGRKTDALVDPSTGTVSASVIYGGTAEVPYAAHVHEDPTGKSHKFLERPLMDMESEILERIARKVRL